MSNGEVNGDRYYITQTCGWTTKGQYEHEYAIIDRETSSVVTLFIAEAVRPSDLDFRALKRRTHLRAREHCRTLNGPPRDVAWADAHI